MVDGVCSLADILSADVAVMAWIQCGLDKCRQLSCFLTAKGPRIVFSRYVRSCMLHGSATLPVRRKNELALSRTELRMVRHMCGVKLSDNVAYVESRERG